ncbi:MerR family transcriptional regulator [Brevibacillus ginsengisoli]|uniref:MerR family transcriptional regulator n=1 Tax=Brevibacillus ginsengisoli TaxID=363854 RepID=UPI003CE84D93
MSDTANKYFTTGEFAKLCRVNKQTLFYYDHIGLMSPDIKNENGYRFYSYRQFELFNVIELLKEVGMPLKEIKPFLENKTPDNFVSLLEENASKIQCKIQNLQHIKQMIETKLRLTKEAIKTDFSHIYLEELAEEKLFISDFILDCTDRDFVKAVSDFIDTLYTHRFDTGYPIGAMVSRNQLLTGDYENYSYLYMKCTENHEAITCYTMPKGLYVVGYHIGKSEKISVTFDRLLEFAKDQGLQVEEYAYEEYVLDALTNNTSEEYVTKIMIGVRSTGEGFERNGEIQ